MISAQYMTQHFAAPATLGLGRSGEEGGIVSRLEDTRTFAATFGRIDLSERSTESQHRMLHRKWR